MVGAKLYRGSGDRSVTENNFHKYRIMYLKSAGLIVIDLIDLGNVIRRVLVAFSLSLLVSGYNHILLRWFILHHNN